MSQEEAAKETGLCGKKTRAGQPCQNEGAKYCGKQVWKCGQDKKALARSGLQQNPNERHKYTKNPDGSVKHTDEKKQQLEAAESDDSNDSSSATRKGTKQKLWMLYSADDGPMRDPANKRRLYYKYGSTPRQVCVPFAKQEKLPYQSWSQARLEDELAAYSVFPVELAPLTSDDEDEESAVVVGKPEA